nr:immunoglobulin heavy chain junction region [Mus musculus]NSM07711.1 immunoglobulin heavy chain junction region [Mus musculus]NSM09748.1 immunoglobulin heavy chain junction region [Mus musculus]
CARWDGYYWYFDVW